MSKMMEGTNEHREKTMNILITLPKKIENKSALIQFLGENMSGIGEASRSVDEFIEYCLKQKYLSENDDGSYNNPYGNAIEYKRSHGISDKAGTDGLMTEFSPNDDMPNRVN